MIARKGKPIRIANKFISQPLNMLPCFNDLKPLLWRRAQSSVPNMNETKHKGFTSVILTNHAWERWNERVSKSLSTIFQLHVYLTSCINHLGRVRFLNHLFATIDEDIIFHYEIREQQFFIISFYGRVTNKPGLSDVNLLFEFLGKEVDRLSLEVSEEQLTNNLLMPIPSHHLIFEGTLTMYELNVYRCIDAVICHLINLNTQQATIWNLNDRTIPLSKSTITALKVLRLEN